MERQLQYNNFHDDAIHSKMNIIKITRNSTKNTTNNLLGLPKDKIQINLARMGGGFGLRAYGHHMVEAAVISQKLQAPVKLMYTREDDMTYGIYRPTYTATYRAALDEKNNLIAFHVRGGGIPEHPVEANRFPAGAVDNYLAEGWSLESNITIGAFDGARLAGRWRLRTIREQTADEWGILLRNLFTLAGLDLDAVRGVIISSVVPVVAGKVARTSARCCAASA